MSDMTITPDTKLQRINEVVATDMNGETVMMHIDKGSYFAISGSGSHIWAALEKPVTKGEVIAQLQDEFETDDVEDLDAIVSTFLASLLKQELVTITQ